MTKYGTDVIRKMLIITVLLDVAAYFIDFIPVKITLFVISIILISFTLYFFRDPKRTIPTDINENTVISPADGKIVLVEEIINKAGNSFPEGEKLTQVSIFLNAFNVHVNRIPISGEVNFYNYIEGDYIVAFDHKSSERNERTEIGIINSHSKMLVFKQIAGLIARRIVCELKAGDSVKAGSKFGMIKFGSRVDILFKPEAKVFVKIGDKVTGGESLIGEL